MYDDIKKQNQFSRISGNEAKMGAYYTDLYHCQLIQQMVDFPDNEVCCLEPSIGDGKAILEITGKLSADSKIKIFGVEINADTSQELENQPLIDYHLQADFLEDVIISHNSFSFCFANPPYGELDGKRKEILFLKKVIPYLTKNAVMILVIPIYVAKKEDFLTVWCSRFHTKLLYRFEDKEFQRFQQIVLIGVQGTEPIENVQKKIESIETIPSEYRGEHICVHSSSEKDINLFSTRVFHPEHVFPSIANSSLHDLIHKRIKVQQYGVMNTGRPPVMPKVSHLYLLATCGLSEGMVGTEEGKDCHLQRGVVKRKKDISYEESDREGDRIVCIEREHPSIAYRIIESDGTISELM